MNISQIFIERPVMTTLLTIWVVLLGVVGLMRLPISALPQIEFPVIQVKASLPGATPETMAQSVALPLEQKLSSVPGLESMVSTSAQGVTQINLQFSLGVSIDAAAQDVGTAISTAQGNLPKDMPNLPSFKKVNPAEQPIVYLALSSETLPMWQVNEYAETIIATRLSMLTNVAQVDLHGQKKYAVRIYAKPEQLAAKGLTISSLENILTHEHVSIASGVLEGPMESVTINPDTQLKNAASFSNLMLRNHDGLRLKDVADVVDDVENLYARAWFNSKPAVLLAVSRQPGSNTIEVAKSITDLLPELRKQLPNSVNLALILDRSESIKASVHEVGLAFFLTLCLVISVIFLFLRDTRATLIPGITLPISIIVTFAIIYALGFSLNNLTLLALTLALGFIIDDAIVVQENIAHYQEQGVASLEAALKGAKEITPTVISMTLSLAAVFMPIVWMSGIVGRLLYEFGLTIVIVVMVSGVTSLTLTPMMCGRIMDLSKRAAEAGYKQLLRQAFAHLEAFYERSLTAIIPYHCPIRWGVLIMLLLNAAAYVIIPKGFFPNEDTGMIYGIMEAPADTSVEMIEKGAYKVLKILEAHPDIRSFNVSIGASSTTLAANQGRFFIVLKGFKSRQHSVEAVINQLRASFADIPEFRITMQPLQNLRIGAILSKSHYQYTIQSQDLKALYKWVPIIQENLAKIKGFLDVSTDLQPNSVQLSLKLNRDRLTQLGLTAKDVADAIQSSYADKEIASIYTETNVYPIILSMSKSQSQIEQDLEHVRLMTPQGTLVPLTEVIEVVRENAALTIGHLNRLPVATISFNLGEGMVLGDAMEKIAQLEQELNLPETITTSFQGAAQAFQKSQSGQLWLILAAILTIYIILGALYESYVHPFTVLTGLPTAGLGALLALMLLGYALDMIGIIGILLLIGIVKKNAIMMIDYALQRQRETQGITPEDAIVSACVRRFRPIMMTTFAAIAGALPIAFWSGSGAEFRRPLGICIIGGLLLSQWLTLYITPAFYIGFERLKQRWG